MSSLQRSCRRIAGVGAAQERRALASVLANRVAAPLLTAPHGSGVKGVACFSTAAPAAPAPAAAAPATGKHVSIAVSDDGIAVVKLDAPGEKVNTLGRAMMEQFEPALTAIETDARIKAAVIISGKADNFIAGADITMLDAAGTAAELTDLSRQGQVLMDRLAACKRPIVAAINGSCLGGGLEVALACSYRIATSSSKTRLGLPEVQLGLLPGAGGTQRLPRLIGIQSALTLMTTGQALSADRALKMGVVDEVVDPSALARVAVLAARELAAGTLARKAGKGTKGLAGVIKWALEGNPLGRSVLFSQATKAVMAASGGHYPAPLAILEAVRTGAEQGHSAGSLKESALFGSLGMTPVSRALRGIFFAQTASKRNPGVKPAAPAKTVGVLGAGLMGAGIAQVTAAAGVAVVMKDRDRAALTRGEAAIADALAPRVKKRRMTAFERDTTLARITGVCDTDERWRAHMARADVVIEAVPEELSLKHAVFKSVEPLLRPDAVLATNTSALPIASIASGAARPERVLGMHYFSPVDRMPLLEIIPHAGTSPAAVGAAFELGARQGKTIIVVKDVPGFYVNRCLAPWAAEGLYLAQCGVAPAALDSAIKKFGYPVGPVALADEVGIDVLWHTYGTMKAALGARMAGADDAWLRRMVEAKWLGRKTGKGFYLYPTDKAGKPTKGEKRVNPDAEALLAQFRTADKHVRADMPADEIAERMVARFVKECIHALEDGIIRSPADGDIGAVFGLGFPPFHGGPFRYADAYGVQKLADTMQRLADANGAHFAPPTLLLDHAKAGKRFHSK